MKPALILSFKQFLVREGVEDLYLNNFRREHSALDVAHFFDGDVNVASEWVSLEAWLTRCLSPKYLFCGPDFNPSRTQEGLAFWKPIRDRWRGLVSTF